MTRWRPWNARESRPALAEHVRLESPNGKTVRWWPTLEAAGEDLADLVYLTPAAGGFPAYLVVTEGEKAADAVAAAGFPAVATVCGASSTPGAAVIELLAAQPVVLWPDADDVGRQHMDRLGRALEAAGVPALSIVRMPDDAPEHADAADVPRETIAALVVAALERPIGPVAA